MALGKNASMFVGLFILCLTCKGWADMQVNMEDRVEVFRRENAHITCMFTSSDGMGGVMIQWYIMTPNNVRQRIYYRDSVMEVVDRGTPLSDRISVNVTGAGSGDAVLTITDVELTDELDFICQVRGLTSGTGEGRTQLRVFEMPQFPTIESVDVGISVTTKTPSKIGTCEAKNGYPKPNITWYRDRTPLHNKPDEVRVQSLTTMESSGLFTVQSHLHMKVVEQDKEAHFYCEVSYFVPWGTKMIETPAINITVYYPSTSTKVWVESPQGLVKEGDTVEIRCRADGNPPPPLSFKHKGETIKSDLNSLVLKGVTRSDHGVYECASLDVDTFLEIADEVQLVVNYLDPAVVLPKEEHVMALGEELVATCNALSSLQTSTVWFKNGEQVAEGHKMTLKDAHYDTAGTYVCVVLAPTLEGLETSRTLTVLVQGPPEIKKSADSALEQGMETSVNLSCYATGQPAPTFTWTSSDQQVLKEVSRRQLEGGVLSVVSVKVTSDLTAYCNATNDFGSDTTSFSIKAKGNGVIIAVIIICILLLAILGSVLYFLYKKGKIPCGRSGKQDLTKEKANKNNIVMEMKSDNTDEAVLLHAINGDKKPPNDQ